MVANAMFMTALETGGVIAEEDGAWRHGGGSLRAAIVKDAIEDKADADIIAPFLERRVIRSCGADAIDGAPPFPCGDDIWGARKFVFSWQ
ncbi:MAG: hypothetical protein DHS20C04_19280 [Hyphococcus sp.]|nr:MAG: hypothetical protein DHS20C04_19280 [Marinicaulis sp.]